MTNAPFDPNNMTEEQKKKALHRLLKWGAILLAAFLVARVCFMFATDELGKMERAEAVAEALAPHATATARMEFGIELEKVWDMQVERGFLSQMERDTLQWNAETRAMHERGELK